MVKFTAILRPDADGRGGTFIPVPREVNEKLGLKGRPKIQAVIAGQPYRGSLMPAGDGTFVLGVLKSIQETGGLKHDDTIDVLIELDTEPRTVQPPADLAGALARDKRAAATWEKLSFTNKREMARSLEEAKKPQTRKKRLAAAVAKLRA